MHLSDEVQKKKSGVSFKANIKIIAATLMELIMTSSIDADNLEISLSLICSIPSMFASIKVNALTFDRRPSREFLAKFSK